MEKTKMSLPPHVKSILNIIESNGHEAYVVGGCVRDYFVGKMPKDYDITTSMLPDDVMTLFKNNGYKVIPTGIKHGTVTVIPSGSMTGEGYEITTFRTDGEYLDGRHPESVSFTSSLEEDLSRRDLTINAMAYSDSKGLVDIFGGLDDIKNKVVRTVGNPCDRFSEDALRMMRAIRFAAQLGYSINKDTFAAIKKLASSINVISKERVHDELVKILLSKNPDYVSFLYETGILKHILPELHVCFFTKQNTPWHLYDVGTHTMAALKNSKCDLTLRMAILLHDIGKPHNKITDAETGIDHFYGHAETSSKKALEVMKRLKFTTKETEDVVLLTKIHDVQIELTDRALRRFLNKFSLDERLFYLFIELKRADNSGQNLELSQAELDKLDILVEMYENNKNQPLSIKDLKVSGYDAMTLGYNGPEIGKEFQKLLSICLDNPELNNHDYLMDIMRKDKEVGN